VLVLGNAGIRAGAGMHGGTIALFGPTPSTVFSSFRYDRTAKPEKLAPVLQQLQGKAAEAFEAALLADMTVYVGDQVADGAGEIHVRKVPVA
jgi:glutamate synthase domain-containing protein 3